MTNDHSTPPSANKTTEASNTPESSAEVNKENKLKVDNKLSKFGDLERVPRRFDQPTAPRTTTVDPQVKSLHDTVKDLIRASIGTGKNFEVESRTDVERYLRVSEVKGEEILLVNTDVYVPGRWFIRRQWRRVGSEPNDDFFLKAARNKK